MELEHLIRQPSAATFPRWGRHTVVYAFDYGGEFCSKLLQSKSQRLEPLAGSIGLLALVHTTRLTGGYDCGESLAPQDKNKFFYL